jgi:hypothetical protein
MSVPNLPSLPHPSADGVTIEYIQHLVNALDFAIEQLNRGEPTKNNILDNLASGDYLQFDGQTFRNKRFPMGSLYISSAAETTLSVQNTWYKAAGTTTDVTIGPEMQGKTILTVDIRIKFIGTVPTHIHGAASFASNTSIGTNKVLEYGAYFYDDSAASGNILAHSVMQRNHGANDIGTGAIHFDVQMNTNDYVEFWIRCTSTPVVNATVDNMYLFIMGVG